MPPSMRPFLILLVVTVAFQPFADATEWTDEKARSTAQILSIATQLGEVARVQTTNYPEATIKRRIDGLIEQIKASEDLVRMALLCYAIQGSGMAEHASYDGVFDYAMWHCARMLSERSGLEGELALAQLKPVIGCDGGSSLTMDELMAAQKKRIAPSPK